MAALAQRARLFGPARRMVVELRPDRRDQGRCAEGVHDGTRVRRRASFVRGRRSDRRTCLRGRRRAGRRGHPGRAGAARPRRATGSTSVAAVAALAGSGGMSSLDLWPIGNCQVSALVDDAAGFVWACQPRVDGDPAVLRAARAEGRQPGRAANGGSRSRTRSRPSSAISRTRRSSSPGSPTPTAAVAEVFDFCPRFERLGADVPAGRLHPHRPPARRRAADQGRAQPRRRLGRARRRADQRHQPYPLPAPSRSRCGSPPTRRSSTCSKAAASGSRSRSISSSGPTSPSSATSARRWRRCCTRPSDHWRDWVRGLAIPLEWQTQVIRAAITLKLCQHEETGAIVAAMTTSIPEARRIRAATGTIATAGSATLITPSRR